MRYDPLSSARPGDTYRPGSGAGRSGTSRPFPSTRPGDTYRPGSGASGWGNPVRQRNRGQSGRSSQGSGSGTGQPGTGQPGTGQPGRREPYNPRRRRSRDYNQELNKQEGDFDRVFEVVKNFIPGAKIFSDFGEGYNFHKKHEKGEPTLGSYAGRAVFGVGNAALNAAMSASPAGLFMDLGRGLYNNHADIGGQFKEWGFDGKVPTTSGGGLSSLGNKTTTRKPKPPARRRLRNHDAGKALGALKGLTAIKGLDIDRMKAEQKAKKRYAKDFSTYEEARAQHAREKGSLDGFRTAAPKRFTSDEESYLAGLEQKRKGLLHANAGASAQLGGLLGLEGFTRPNAAPKFLIEYASGLSGKMGGRKTLDQASKDKGKKKAWFQQAFPATGNQRLTLPKKAQRLRLKLDDENENEGARAWI